MPRPQDVKPADFTVRKVVYDQDGFAVAWGTWNKATPHELRLAMRWNGNDGDIGFPNTFGHPVWFLVPKNLNVAFLRTLLGERGAADTEIITAMMDAITANT